MQKNIFITALVTAVIIIGGLYITQPTLFKGDISVSNSIGDFVWEDLNSNGVWDMGEPGLSGIAVDLLGDTGDVIASTTTDAGGIYMFTGLSDGSYSVKVHSGPFTAQNVEPEASDSDVDASGVSDSTPISGGMADTYRHDAGVLPAMTPPASGEEEDNGAATDEGDPLELPPGANGTGPLPFMEVDQWYDSAVTKAREHCVNGPSFGDHCWNDQMNCQNIDKIVYDDEGDDDLKQELDSIPGPISKEDIKQHVDKGYYCGRDH